MMNEGEPMTKIQGEGTPLPSQTHRVLMAFELYFVIKYICDYIIKMIIGRHYDCYHMIHMIW